MTPLQLILILVGAGVLSYVVRRMKFIDEPYREGIAWVILLVAALVILRQFGALDWLWKPLR